MIELAFTCGFSSSSGWLADTTARADSSRLSRSIPAAIVRIRSAIC
jgi:hypothetical protein